MRYDFYGFDTTLCMPCGMLSDHMPAQTVVRALLGKYAPEIKTFKKARGKGVHDTMTWEDCRPGVRANLHGVCGEQNCGIDANTRPYYQCHLCGMHICVLCVRKTSPWRGTQYVCSSCHQIPMQDSQCQSEGEDEKEEREGEGIIQTALQGTKRQAPW